jgi:mannose-1-phosphate guanylyltransferase/mannose-6-phosphate isomerase
MIEDTANCYLSAADNMLLLTIGLRDLVVIATDDAVLVADRRRSDEVKSLVARLKAQGRSEAGSHRKVHRPWGSFETIGSGSQYQVKRIELAPGASISLQKHFHRAEHWVIVNGTALVHRDGEEKLLRPNESTYIPIGAIHRLTNPGKIPLVMIEVQSGTYLSEDDIVRFDDHYNRV